MLSNHVTLKHGPYIDVKRLCTNAFTEIGAFFTGSFNLTAPQAQLLPGDIDWFGLYEPRLHVCWGYYWDPLVLFPCKRNTEEQNPNIKFPKPGKWKVSFPEFKWLLLRVDIYIYVYT